MLKNRIVTNDLKRYDSSIEKWLPKEQPDWQPQITEAFEVVKDKIRARGYDTRILGVPLDLNRLLTSTASQNVLTPVTRTVAYTGLHVNGFDGFNRWVLNVTTLTLASGYTFTLQGSNDIGITATIEPTNWSNVVTVLPSKVEEYSQVIQTDYKYYRVVLAIVAGSVTFTSSMIETYIDRWTIWQALSLIYQMISKSPDDGWMHKSDQAMINFQMAFDSYKFSIDANEDNLIDSDNDEMKATKTLIMTR